MFHVLNTTVWAYKLEGKGTEKWVVETYLYITQLLSSHIKHIRDDNIQVELRQRGQDNMD